MSEVCPFAIPGQQDKVQTSQLEEQFDRMRGEGALTRASFPYGTRNDGVGWVATGYKEAKFILTDNRFSLAQQRQGDYPRARAMEVGGAMPLTFIGMDPPEHSERRRTLMKHLTHGRVQSLRAYTERVVEQCLDDIEREGHGADLLAGFAHTVPLLLLCELLGAPPEERDHYVQHARDIVSSRLTAEQAADAFNIIKEYFRTLVDRKRKSPGDDLISDLLTDTEIKGLWSSEELEGVGTVLLLAGHDSTSAFMANALYWLVHSPETYAELRVNPASIPKAIDEFLRLLPVGVPGARTRVALEDVQVGDRLVRRDESVLAVTHAANLDPSIFPCPREFDATRGNQSQHIAFGFGGRFCPGAALAKMDIEMMLRGLTARFETLEPIEFDPDWREKSRTRGPESLRVKWQK